jgi:preprotein translocase subunit SecG
MVTAIIYLLTTVQVIAALLLIGIVLIQQSKAGGGLTAMGGGMTETVFGASAGNVLTRGTVILASVFLGAALILAVITGHRGPRRSVGESLKDRPVAEEPAEPAAEEDAAEPDTPADTGAAAAPDAAPTDGGDATDGVD